MTDVSQTDASPASPEGLASSREVPAWLAQPQAYDPLPDRDAFVTRSILSVSSVLARLRLDDGVSTRLSPSAPVKLLMGLACILLTSLSRNYLFVLVMLAAVVTRAAILPREALRRTVATACAAAALTLVIMAPAALLGQARSAPMLATKALVSTGLAMEVALTTPFAQLTGALRTFRVPNLAILSVDLALRSIARLGEASLEVLTALRLRSVGRNRDKAASMGGVGGAVLLKAAEASRDTYDAMRCRGFEGEYDVRRSEGLGWRDAVWLALMALVVILFAYLQRLV